ncbi:MAG: hypothetical protein AAGC85_04585 [Bacteroidota bacterium]
MIYLFLLSTLFPLQDGIQLSINHQEKTYRHIVSLSLADEIDLYADKEVNWVVYKPIFREYDNLTKGAHSLAEIDYELEVLSATPTKHISLDLPPGTHYLGFVENKVPPSLSTSLPLHLTNAHIVQLVVREEDSYVGFLTELLGLPFILPPKLVGIYGHQTDLRVGTDCAELAIYGARRIGYDIPYGGPRGILDYLVPTNELKKGTIIHYGFQVSVLYEDRGVIGELDEEDLLIHAYGDRVAIQKLGDIELAKKGYKLYKWKFRLEVQ